MNGAAETRQECRSPALRRGDLDCGREAEALEQFLAVLPAEPKLLRGCQAQPTDNPHQDRRILIREVPFANGFLGPRHELGLSDLIPQPGGDFIGHNLLSDHCR